MSASGRPCRNKLLGVEATRRPAGRRIRDLELLRLYVTPALGKIRLPNSRPATSPRRCAQWSPVASPPPPSMRRRRCSAGRSAGQSRRTSSIAMPHPSQCRMLGRQHPSEGQVAAEHDPLGTSSLRSGISRYSVDQDQVHFFAPCEGSICALSSIVSDCPVGHFANESL